MSPQDARTATSEPAQPQFYPVIHPEFGYLVPARGFRHKAALVGKSIAVGALAGAIAGMVLLPDSGGRLQSTFSMQTQAAGDMLATAPVRFVAAALAMPAAESPSTVGLATSPRPAPLPTPAVAAEPPEHKPILKPKKKVARQPKRKRSAPADIDAPRASAGPYRRAPIYSSNDRPRFGFGW